MHLSFIYSLFAVTAALASPTSSKHKPRKVLDTQKPAANGNPLAAGTGSGPSIESSQGILVAPSQNDTAPDDAVVYKPSNPPSFNLHDFNMWIQERVKAATTKWLAVQPGNYTMYIDTSFDGYNQDIEIAGLRGPGLEDYVLDFRGSIFNYAAPITETEGNPVGAIYVAQCNRLTILGGEFWIHGPEPYSQGVIKSKTPADDANGNDAINIVTIAVDDGYDLSAWQKLDSGSLSILDARDPAHYKRVDTHMKISVIKDVHINEAERTVSAYMNNWAAFEVGMHASIAIADVQVVAVSAEMDSELVVRGMTTNGKFDQYGLHANELPGTKNKPESWVDCVVTNPPLRGGKKERVNGPTVWSQWPGWYNNDDESEGPGLVNSWWQSTGCLNDKLLMSVKEPAFEL